MGPRLREHPEADEDFKQITDEDIRKTFFEALLQVVRPLRGERMPVAANGITAAVREELGLRTQREEDEAIALVQTMEHHRMIVEVAARKCAKGERPPDGGGTLYDVARQELAEILGIDDDTLRKRLLRLERFERLLRAPPTIEEFTKLKDVNLKRRLRRHLGNGPWVKIDHDAIKEAIRAAPDADPWPMHIEEIEPTRSMPRRYVVISDDRYLPGKVAAFESREAAERYIAAIERELEPPPPSAGSQPRGK